MKVYVVVVFVVLIVVCVRCVGVCSVYSVEEVHSWRLHAERPAHEAPVPVSATTGTGLTSYNNLFFEPV